MVRVQNILLGRKEFTKISQWTQQFLIMNLQWNHLVPCDEFVSSQYFVLIIIMWRYGYKAFQFDNWKPLVEQTANALINCFVPNGFDPVLHTLSWTRIFGIQQLTWDAALNSTGMGALVVASLDVRTQSTMPECLSLALTMAADPLQSLQNSFEEKHKLSCFSTACFKRNFPFDHVFNLSMDSSSGKALHQIICN